MSLPAWFGRSLPCGCVRGVRLCDEAVRRWDAVADAHNKVAQQFRDPEAWQQTPATTAYETALAAFSAHVEIEAEPAVQSSML